MTAKQYKIISLILVFISSMAMSICAVHDNYIVPIILMVVMAPVLYVLKKRVKNILADERDYEVAGKAARWAVSIFCVLGSVMVFVLLFYKSRNSNYEVIAYVLAFSILVLMCINCVIILFEKWKIYPLWKRIILTWLALAFGVSFLMFGIRLFSGEDDWMCVNGNWIEHGYPDSPMPTTECK